MTPLQTARETVAARLDERGETEAASAVRDARYGDGWAVRHAVLLMEREAAKPAP